MIIFWTMLMDFKDFQTGFQELMEAPRHSKVSNGIYKSLNETLMNFKTWFAAVASCELCCFQH